MRTDEAIAVVDAEVAGDPAEPYSVAWWERRTAEELRDIINRGFAGGQVFKAAVAEAERRARQETKRLRELAAANAQASRRRKEIGWGVAVSILALSAVLGFWLGR